VNVENPSSPYVASKIGDFGGRIAVYGNFLYVGWDYLGIIDVSIPESPVVVYRGDMVYGLRTICPYSDGSGVYLVVTCDIDVGGRGEVGIRVIDVTDPSSPELLDWYYVPEEITDWYYVVHHNLASISVVYPYLFAFETIEYVDTSFYWGGYEDGYVQVKMFDLRDLSAPPVVWRSEILFLDPYVGLLFLGATVGDDDIYILGGGYHYLRYTADEIIEECGSSSDESEYHLYPRYAVGDTHYVIGYGRGLMGIKWETGCVIDTLGYYGVEGLDHYVSSVKIEDERIYVNTRQRVYILRWSSDRVNGDEIEMVHRYRIYPSPVVMGGKIEISKELDRSAGIYDISGKLRDILKPGARTINTRGLSPGVYFLISDDKKIRLKFVVI